MTASLRLAAFFCPVLALLAADPAGQTVRPIHRATDGTVRDHALVSNAAQGFADDLDDLDAFGSAVACLGDVDGNGVPDLAVGAQGDDDGGGSFGAVYLLFRDPDGSLASKRKLSAYASTLEASELGGDALAPLGDQDGDGVPDLAVGDDRLVTVLFLNADGTVKAMQEIGPGKKGGLKGAIPISESFGMALAALGDLDGDGVGDLAVGGELVDDGGFNRGALWVLFLNANGTVKDQQKISDTLGGFQGGLADGENFGSALAGVGDLDGDGVGDLAVGAAGGGSLNRGAVWILFLNADGTVKDQQEIAEGTGGFQGTLVDQARFGLAAASPGDLDGDGLAELAVGAPAKNHPGLAEGSVWLLFLNADGTVRDQQEIGQSKGGFPGQLEDGDSFGDSLGAAGDLDGDGLEDLLVGVPGHDALARGGVWTLHLAAGGTVLSGEQIDGSSALFVDTLEKDDHLGSSVAALGDLDGDGTLEIAVGAREMDSEGTVWIFSLDEGGTIQGTKEIGSGKGGFSGVLDDFDRFGGAVSVLGDLDGNGVPDLAVGAHADDDGGADAGAVWILYLAADGSVLANAKISATSGGFQGALVAGDHFGTAVCAVGDLTGDGITELAVGAPGLPGPGSRNAVWILALNADGTVAAEQLISESSGGFQGALDANDSFGSSLASVGDFDGDGIAELAVGAPYDGEGQAPNTFLGAVWILSLTAQGTVKAEQKIGAFAGGFQGSITTFDHFGAGLAGPGDLNGDGIPDLVVGMPDDAGGGTIWVLFLTPQATVAHEQEINAAAGGFRGPVESQDQFGASLASLGDLDGDGLPDLAVGAPYDDDGGEEHGCVWVLYLEGARKKLGHKSPF